MSPSENADRGREPDPGFDEQALYVVVRTAVKDALLDVFWTVLALGLAVVFVWAGAQIAISQGVVGLAAGIPLVLFGCYGAAVALEILPAWLDPL